MLRDRVGRSLFAVALATLAGPARASDFRGFLSMFVAIPALCFVALSLVFVLARRAVLIGKPAWNLAAVLAALASLVPGSFAAAALGLLFLRQGLAQSAAGTAITLGYLFVAWRIWRDPRGATARWSARGLLLLTCGATLGMIWDLHERVLEHFSADVLWVLLGIALLVSLCGLLCVLTLRRPRAAPDPHALDARAPG